MTKKVDKSRSISRPAGLSPYSAAREIRLTAGGGHRQFKGHRAHVRLGAMGTWRFFIVMFALFIQYTTKKTRRMGRIK
jgi:hypothetical protein